MELLRNRRILVILIPLLLLLTIAAIWNASIYRNPYGYYLEIANLDEFTAGKPTNEDRLDFIKHSLYNNVSLNSDDEIENNSITDVLVREGSFSQVYDQDVHTVKFIVDIQSLRQSYGVAYQWVDNEDLSDSLDEYGTRVSCLPSYKLIYDDFGCTDELMLEAGQEGYVPTYIGFESLIDRGVSALEVEQLKLKVGGITTGDIKKVEDAVVDEDSIEHLLFTAYHRYTFAIKINEQDYRGIMDISRTDGRMSFRLTQ